MFLTVIDLVTIILIFDVPLHLFNVFLFADRTFLDFLLSAFFKYMVFVQVFLFILFSFFKNCCLYPIILMLVHDCNRDLID